MDARKRVVENIDCNVVALVDDVICQASRDVGSGPERGLSSP
jgi:hypothetical protein